MFQFYRIIFIACLAFSSMSLPAKDNNIIILGDSLSAAYGMPLEMGWVSLLEDKLNNNGYKYNIINASISGETTSGVVARIDDIIKVNIPDIVIIELGGNDGLRGFPFSEIKNNLVYIIKRIQETTAQIILIPMQLPPNYGQAYNQKFQQVYKSIANEYDIILSPFILENIATDTELMQDDGIHPVAMAQPKMLENIWPTLEAIMQRLD
ncbi:MAG: arylesterase [Pseudomonadota bacterium]